LNLSMVWGNNPAGVYEQGRYGRGLIRNLGDLIAPPYEKNRHRCAMRYTNQALAFWDDGFSPKGDSHGYNEW
jgi:hypothetical protein